MVEDSIEPSDEERKAIINQLQHSDHEILTRTEIAEAVDDLERKSVERRLNWMVEADEIAGRKLSDRGPWVYSVSLERSSPVSAEESVLTAQEVLSNLKKLFSQRREFQVIGAGILMLWSIVSIAFYFGIDRAIGLGIMPWSTTVTIAAVLFSGGVLLIVGGLMLFPIETGGNWPLALEQGDDDSE